MGSSITTLLTGFSTFGSVVDNPTERLVRHFAEHGASGHTLTTCVLPVSYRRAPGMILTAVQAGDASGRPFDLIWMHGVASAAPTWRVERYGRNENASRQDTDGYTPSRRVAEDGPDSIKSTVDVDRLVSALSANGFPAAASDSAGTYLCNHVLYTVLRHLQQCGSEAAAGFLHVPADPATTQTAQLPSVCFSFEDHIRAATVALDALAESLRTLNVAQDTSLA